MIEFHPGVIPNDPAKPRLKMSNFITATAVAPVVVDFDDVPMLGMFDNDQLGDCVFAGNGHTIQQQTFFGQGKEAVITSAEVVESYERVGGYSPDKPGSDKGAAIQDGLNDLRRHGLGGHKLAAFAELHVTDMNEVKLAIAEFGSVAVGMSVPKSCMQQHAEGKPWDVVADDGGILGGHRVTAFAYDATYIYVATWASVQKMTYGFWAKYISEAWAQITPDWVSAATKKSPTGIDEVALGDQYAALTGQPNPFTTSTHMPAVSGKAIVAALSTFLALLVSYFGKGIWLEIGAALKGVWRQYPAVTTWVTNIVVCIMAKIGFHLDANTVLIGGAALGSVMTVVVHHSTIHVAKARMLAMLRPGDPGASEMARPAPLFPKKGVVMAKKLLAKLAALRVKLGALLRKVLPFLG